MHVMHSGAYCIRKRHTVSTLVSVWVTVGKVWVTGPFMVENGSVSVKSVWKSVEKCEKVQNLSSKIEGLKCGFLIFHSRIRLTELWFWWHSCNGIFASTVFSQFSIVLYSSLQFSIVLYSSSTVFLQFSTVFSKFSILYIQFSTRPPFYLWSRLISTVLLTVAPSR